MLDFHSDDAEWPKPREEFPPRSRLHRRVRVVGLWKRHSSVRETHAPARVADCRAYLESSPVFRLSDGSCTERRSSGQPCHQSSHPQSLASSGTGKVSNASKTMAEGAAGMPAR